MTPEIEYNAGNTKQVRGFLPQIIRASRKYFQLTQTQMASALDISQGAISKIETGDLILDCHQWMKFCKDYQINPDSLFTGLVEFKTHRKIERVNHLPRIGNFKIPSRYAFNIDSSVIFYLPLLRWIIEMNGQNYFESFCQEKNLDSDLFLIPIFPINSLFIRDLYLDLIKKNSTIFQTNEIWPKIFGPMEMALKRYFASVARPLKSSAKQLKISVAKFISEITHDIYVDLDPENNLLVITGRNEFTPKDYFKNPCPEFDQFVIKYTEQMFNYLHGQDGLETTLN